MAVNIGPRIGIDGEAEYRKQINAIIQQTKTLKSEYEKVSSAMEKGKTTLKGNAEQHKVLSETVKTQEKRVEELSKMVEQSTAKYGEADTKTLKWKEALNKATTELNNMKQQLKDLPTQIGLVGEKMEEAGKKIESIGKGIKNLGKTLTPISTTATAAIAGSVKTFMDFESQMSRVKAISGATGEEFESLSQKARDMGASTKFTATEAGQAFEYMAMAGWKSEQMMEGIAPVMNLAAASGEELGTVSDIVTDALTAFGLEAKDAAEFTDVLAATATNANTNVGMMGESFKYAAPVAGSLGYSIEDVSLALGLMANSGIKADMAGTSLRNMMLRMAKPTKESATAMERLGLSLTDDEGNMLSLRQIMDQLRKSFGKINMPVDEFNKQLASLNEQFEAGELTEKKYGDAVQEIIKQAYGAEAAEKARAAAMLAGTRAMPGMLAMVNASEKDYRKLASAIDNSAGAAQNMADTMIDNTAGAVTIMKSAVEGAGIELGEVFAPYVTKAAETVQGLAVKFSELSQKEQETIAKQIAFAAASAPALKAIGDMTEGVGKLVETGGHFLTWLGGLGPAAPAIVGVVGGVAAVTGGIMALQTAIDNVRAESINEALSKALKNEGGTPIEELFSSITDKITELSGSFELVAQKSAQLDQAKANVSNLTAEIDKIKISMDAGVISTEEGAAQIEEKLSSLADAISSKMTAASDVLLAALGDGGALAQSLDKTGMGVDEMRQKVVESVDNVQEKITELEDKMNNAQYGSDAWFEAYNELMELGGGVDAVKESVEGFSSYVDGNPIDWSKYFSDGTFDLEGFRNDLQATGDAAATYSEGMKTSMDSVVEAVDQIGDPELTAAIKDAIPGAMTEGNSQIAEKAMEAVNIMQRDMIGGIEDVMNQAKQDWAEMSPWKKLFMFGGDEQSYVLSQVRTYKSNTVDPASAEIEAMMNELGVDGAGWAGDAMEEIMNGLFDIPTQAEAAQGATATLKANWKDILSESTATAVTEAEGYGKDVVEGLNNGIEQGSDTSKEAAESWMQKLKTAIHDSVMKFGSPSQTAKDFGKDTVDGYNEGISDNASTSETETQTWMDGVNGVLQGIIPDFISNFEEMRDGASSAMDEAHGNVDDAMDRIKKIFDTKLEFPEIKLPHFSIDGSFSLNPPKVPHISVDWYAKAMASGMRLTNATIFGAQGNKLLGGGEAGNEWVVGESSILSMIRSAVHQAVGYIPDMGNTVNIGDTQIVINAAPGQDAEEIADAVDEIITMRYQQARQAWA